MLARRSFTPKPRPDRAPMAWPGKQEFAPASRADGAGEACPKPVEHRNPALLAMARGKRCLFLIPGTCNHDQRTTVACHENQGKGMGTKAPDFRSVQGCSACHTAYDQGPAPREIKRGWFAVAHARQVEDWQRRVGDMSETPRDRRAMHWALLLLESNPTPALDTRAQLAMKGIAT